MKTRNQTNISNFRIYRNQVNNLIRKAKSAYFLNKFKSATPTIMWKNINDLLGHLRKEKSEIQSLIINTEEINEKQEIVNQFNKYFVNFGANPGTTIL